MATSSRRPPRPTTPSTRTGQRRGSTAGVRPTSQGAARRSAHHQQTSSRRLGWAAVAVVILVIAVFVIVKVTSSSPPPSTTGDAAGRSPALASASIVTPVTTISPTVFNTVGTGGDPAGFVVTKGQPALTANGLPRMVYEGAEYCPYCALMRWSLVAALSRFGTFHNLRFTSSAASDGNIPTFSFLGTTYTSKYVSFSAYEEQDRNQQPLQSVPAKDSQLFLTYDGNGTSAATPFNTGGQAGIPFLDIGNKYVSSGDPISMSNLFVNGTLNNGGPGVQEIANAIAAPNSAVGKAIDAKVFIAEANYISASICALNGHLPASVCASPGVAAAAKVLAAVKPVG